MPTTALTGSSQNVHVALLATLAPGETVVMARNGHKSASAAQWRPAAVAVG